MDVIEICISGKVRIENGLIDNGLIAEGASNSSKKRCLHGTNISDNHIKDIGLFEEEYHSISSVSTPVESRKRLHYCLHQFQDLQSILRFLLDN